MNDAAQRLAEPGGARPAIRDLIMRAREFERSRGSRIRRMIAMYSRVRSQWLAIRHPVPALDDLRPRRADAAQKAVSRQCLQGHRGHRRASRRARRHLQDAGAGLDRLGLCEDPGDRRHRVGAVGLRRTTPPRSRAARPPTRGPCRSRHWPRPAAPPPNSCLPPCQVSFFFTQTAVPSDAAPPGANLNR